MELVTAIKSFNCAQKRGQEGAVLLVLKLSLEGQAPNGTAMAELQALEEEEYVHVTITRLKVVGGGKKRTQTELDL